MLEEIVFNKFRFDNIESFADMALAWDIDFRQLNPGEFRADLMQLIFKNLHFSHSQLNCKIDQQGSPPKTHWTFAILEEKRAPFLFRGYALSANDVMIFQPGAEIDGLSQDDFSIFTYAISEKRIDSIGQVMGLPEVSELVKKTDRITCSPSGIKKLRHHLTRFSKILSNCSSGLQKNFIFKELSQDIPETLFSTLIAGRIKETPKLRLRNQAIKQALACIEMSTGENLTVSGLCRTSGVSMRTLEYAFLERFGITPKVYIRAFRLNRVRETLVRSKPSENKISVVANAFGFWHMGQFAKDYKNLFGELPYTTLNTKGLSLQD